MSDVLRFAIKQNGLYSSLPYACMWVVSIATGFLSDWLITNKHVTITNARKLFTTIGKLKFFLFTKNLALTIYLI